MTDWAVEKALEIMNDYDCEELVGTRFHAAIIAALREARDGSPDTLRLDALERSIMAGSLRTAIDNLGGHKRR